MALTYSTMMNLGCPAADVILPDTVCGEHLSLTDVKGEVARVVLFICNHCPSVEHINGVLVAIANGYSERGIAFVAISSNDVTAHPAGSPADMKDTALKNNCPFPYLYDETQATARAYDAASSPDIFVFDQELKLVYRGRMDDTRPGGTRPMAVNSGGFGGFGDRTVCL